jgi:hypothetical protein
MNDYDAYWQWFQEAKLAVKAVSTGTEIDEELRRLEFLFRDARDEDEI